MAAGDLTTVDTALAWLGLQNDIGPGLVARVVTAASAQIQQFLSRTIAATSYSITLNGTGGQCVMVPDYPIISVSSVTVDFQAIPARNGRSPGFVSNGDAAIYLDRPYSFARGIQNVQLAFQAGYATTPPDVEMACLVLTKMMWESKDFAATVSARAAGDHSLKFDNAITKLSGSVVLLPSTILDKLQPYARVFPA
jgi:hypothetical protein